MRSGQRLIVAVGATPGSMDNALPSSEGKSARNVVAALGDFAELPDRWQGYEGVDMIILSTSRSGLLTQATAHPSRVEALDQWVHAGGTLVLTAGANAEKSLGPESPLARFVPGHYHATLQFRGMEQIGAWETLAGSHNPIPPANPDEKNVDLPVAQLFVDVQGRVEALANDVPLAVRKARGLGQVLFVATDLDCGSMAAWSDRPLLMAAILDLPLNETPAETNNAVESYGYDDLAGQLRSSLEQFRGVRLMPFFVVASLLVLYILLIGPGDYFLLRRLRRGMQWTWLTFPAVVVLFAVGGYWASSWLKRDVPRLNQVDLIDIDADGTARGASWFSIFDPRAEIFDLSLRPRLPNGEPPQQVDGSLGWFGKAGNGFNGMYDREAQNAGTLAGLGYSIGPRLDSARDVPIQAWSCKNLVYRWLGRGDCPDFRPSTRRPANDVVGENGTGYPLGALLACGGLEFALQEDGRQPSGTITNHLKRQGVEGGVTLTHAYLAYDGWAYLLGTLRPGETREIGPSTRRVSLNTFLSSESAENCASSGGPMEKTPYDPATRDAAYVLRAMLFYDVAGGRKRTGMANDYQRFTDLSAVFRTGRAVLVAMPPQEESCRGAEVLRNQQPLSGPLDRHTIIYRFVVPVGKPNP